MYCSFKQNTEGHLPGRRQVAKACDWCRLNRIKCDDSISCRNCRKRGTKCSRSGRGELLLSLPQAMKEIEQLRARVRVLEKQVDEQATSVSTASLASRKNAIRSGVSQEKGWEGVWMKASGGSEPHLYGPLSSSFFISRMNSFLGVSLQRWSSEQHLIPDSASKVFTRPEFLTESGANSRSISFLSREQEAYFLRLFWQTFQATLPILDEVNFRDYYEALWKAEESKYSRQPGPLADIITALCIQYGMGFVPRSSAQGFFNSHVDINDSSIAGRQYYCRCQRYLTLELEKPSISTVQCHVYSSLYLHNASFVNMAYTTLATAVRTAHTLGLHLEPPNTLPKVEKQLRIRLWWAIFAIDAKLSISLGRPPLARMSLITCSLPTASREEEKLSRSQLNTPKADITWLSYQTFCVKMIIVSQDVSIVLQEKWRELINVYGGDIYNNSQLLEDLAATLSQNLCCIQEWVDSVPLGLRNERQSGGKSFSPGKATLTLDHWLPSWLQLQRVLLEIRYHDQLLNVYRPFVRFSISSDNLTPLADNHAMTCLNHAITNTHIIHQILTETNILQGWHEAYKVQWNSAISIAGFCFGYPISPCTSTARSSLDMAVEVFRLMGETEAVATSAANVILDLAQKSDIIIRRFRQGDSPAEEDNRASHSGHGYLGVTDSNFGDQNIHDNVEAPFPNTDSIDDGIWNGGSEFQFPFKSFVDLDTLMSDGYPTNLWQEFLTN